MFIAVVFILSISKYLADEFVNFCGPRKGVHFQDIINCDLLLNNVSCTFNSAVRANGDLT